MLLSATCILLMLSISTIGAQAKSDEVERGNEFIDKVLQDVIDDPRQEFDPFPMEDSRVGFNRKVLLVNVSGEAKLFNGYINGMKTLHRANDCKLREKDDRLYVNSDIGVGVVTLKYDGTVKFMNLGPTVTIHGSVNYIEMVAEFSVDSKTGRNATIHEFKIHDLRGLKVWITGMAPLRWAINPILSAATKIFQRHLKTLLENKIREHTQEKLIDYQFPVDGSGEVTSGTDASTVEEIRTETINPETEEPVTDEETEEPVTDEETKEPVTDEETEEPVTEEETVEPITEEETEEPATEEETVEPITEEETEEPVTEEETEEPVTEGETEESVAEDETQEPGIDEETVDENVPEDEETDNDE